jgi:hypothetical protein
VSDRIVDNDGRTAGSSSNAATFVVALDSFTARILHVRADELSDADEVLLRDVLRRLADLSRGTQFRADAGGLD